MATISVPPATRATLQSIAMLHEACGDPSRLRLINLLAGGEQCVCDLVDLMGESQPFVSRHLARLRAAKIVGVERRGKFAYYHLLELPAPTQRQLDAILEGLAEADPRLRRERNLASTSAAKRSAAPCQ
jgi:ArsR family transcriptional regulator